MCLGISSVMARKKAKKMMESDSDMGLDEDMNAGIMHVGAPLFVWISMDFFFPSLLILNMLFMFYS